MPIVVKTVTVPALGVGRKDYSTNVEMSVEPLIRSWQEEYQFYDTFVVPAGSSVTREIDIPTQTVVMMYDVYLSTTLNALLHLLAEFYTSAGTFAPHLAKSGYQCVDAHLTKGWGLFRKWRITVTNYAVVDVTCYFSAHGIVTSETSYYGRWGP